MSTQDVAASPGNIKEIIHFIIFCILKELKSGAGETLAKSLSEHDCYSIALECLETESAIQCYRS